MKVLITLLIVAFLAAASANPLALDLYDCAGKSDGNYPHPIDCTRFISCSNGLAYEMDCGICNADPVLCPQGRLIFDEASNQCLYANEAACNNNPA